MNLRKRQVLDKPSLKPFKFPDGFILISDTREQRPLFSRPPKGLIVTTDTLSAGDYSIKGFESKFCIERKGISDFYAYIGKDRDKTIRKMETFSAMSWVGLVIETTELDLLAGYMMSRVPPEVARQALVSFEVRYGVHVYYSKSRDDISRWVLDRAIKFFRVMREAK